MKRAIILLSGGLDSVTTLAIAKNQGFECYALSFKYGQRHSRELECASFQAKKFNCVTHWIANIDLHSIGGSSLTADIPVPKNQYNAHAVTSHIPSTYVPARNTIFLSFAAAWAETTQSSHIFIGANSIDYSGYPDCRPEFLNAFEKVIHLGTKTGLTNKIKIDAPLIKKTKSEIITLGYQLNVDYRNTHSCYDPPKTADACGACDSCVIRRNAFSAIYKLDPIQYVHSKESSQHA